MVIGSQIIPFHYNAPHLEETVKMLKDIGVDLVTIKPAAKVVKNPSHNWEANTHEVYKDLFNSVQEK